ncbi:NAD-dependent epimerase/dehydratase OS=Granulicella mallensis (strain ATCC BAA-1857 / DSM 23137 / MP5ACTX8) GN=AciX8_0978 PE=4 SV=1: NAD_binding_10 [Gemmataceae bacterium]|nr:NAD-dependent epimerase/dehydratase OS=Granulicella mallensis (strain ATCC BAA-1857 / DSM 23137 / MP5ACTX8) GN=AciX8_0978 PE=4 SV=1: NAD_binding_10 [Gemmataceae bacterium]VTT98842.1 NAD-dependent epimerase/dehydratase OS=Granulicella mallensis (strain ATCC BAA-1857 / DSM 23137 / MP5ACTX8) GN=AciX8_0978 PE=4 SV=1: NAD_binding_10 [Gemmataceae bacterium]
MNVFVAGASGAIGRPLVAELIRRGHAVTGMTRSEAGAEALSTLSAAVVRASAFDAPDLEKALRESKAEVVIDELTALPKSPADMAGAAEGDRKLRVEGGGNLLTAARACGVRRYVQQASGFFLRPGPGLGDESEGMAVDATPRVSIHARTYAELEARVLNADGIEGVALRYGFYYGPGTWYHPDGASADMVRRQQVPIIGDGGGVWSWVHIEDAALATADALTIPPGVYHVVDDDPSPVSAWLPAFARAVGAAPPPQVTVEQALATAGEDAVYYGTRLRGASNTKAKRVFGFKPRRLEWLAK